MFNYDTEKYSPLLVVYGGWSLKVTYCALPQLNILILGLR